MKKSLLVFGIVAVASLSAKGGQAATDTAQFSNTITINTNCTIDATGTGLDFGTHGVLTSVIQVNTSFTVQCTTGLTYDIGLDGGTNGGTTTTRTLYGGGGGGPETVNYKMFSDAGHSQNWGNTVATDTPAQSTGNGAAQSHTVYGQVPVQATPTAGTFNDTITITVTF